MRPQAFIAGPLVAAGWLIAAAPAVAAAISPSGLAGSAQEHSTAAPLYAHDGSAATVLVRWAASDSPAGRQLSLTGFELVDARAFAVVASTAAVSEVARAFEAGDAHLIPEAEGQRSAEATLITLQVLPSVEWKAEPMVDRDLANIAAEPIPTISIDPSAVAWTVIVATPATAADADVPPPLEPVVQGGVVALNLMLSAAMTLFERFSTMLHKFLFV